MKKINLIITLYVSLISYHSLSQTGPAGVGNTGSNSFWVDANSLSVNNGDNVSYVSDVSGNGNDFTQVSSTKQPQYQTSVVNGLPALSFDGGDFLVSNSISSLESSEISWFAVYQKASMQSQGIIGGSYDSNPKQWESYCNYNSDYVINSHYSTGSITYNKYLDDGSFNFLENVVSPTNIKTYENGDFIATKNGAYTSPTGHNFVCLGVYPSLNSSFLNGYVAEAFVLNYAVNGLERILIENYLGAKYDISIPTDLYSGQASHNINVVGIGNDGVNIQNSAKGNGNVLISSPSSLSTDDYLLFGHTNVSINSIVTDGLVPGGISTHSRYERTWKVDETGDVGDIVLTFDLSGSAGFADPATYNLLIDHNDDGDFSDADVISGVYNAVNQEIVFNVISTDINSGDVFTLSGLYYEPSAIRSINTGEWSNPITWDCGCIPSEKDTVYIENNKEVTVDIEASAYHLTIEPGSTLKMNDNFELKIYGDLDMNGVADVTDGKISFVGDINQTIDANGSSLSFNELELNNTTQSTINFVNGQYLLNNTLIPLKGNMIIAGSATFTINSTSANTTGRIGQMSSNCSISGIVSVRRFLPAGVTGERDLSSPVVNATLSQWDANLYMSGEGFPDGCAYGSEGCYYSVREYISGEYSDITNINHTLASGQGYEIYVGTDLENFDGAVITSTGNLRSYQDYTMNIPRNGWSIMGNPYASPITFGSIDKHPNIGNYFYVYDPVIEGYQWYDASNNSQSTNDLLNGVLSIGQGFWVYNANQTTDKYFTYKQSDKTSNTATFIRNSNLSEEIYLTLSEEGTTYKCISSVDFDRRAYDDFDSLDLKHLSTGFEKASSLVFDSNDGFLRKQYVSDDNYDKVLDLTINILNDGYFTVSSSELSANYRYSHVLLLDNETGNITNLSKNESYSFYATEGEYQRFKLILSNKEIQDLNVKPISENELDDEITISQLGNAINIEAESVVAGNSIVTITNLLGQDVIYSENIQLFNGSNIVTLPSNYNGIYLITVVSPEGVRVTKKIIL